MPILAGRLTASATLFETAVGESRTIAIGDGTTINLNSATRIAVELRGRHREVHLVKGEAFFSVAPGDGRSIQVFAPFAIAAADGAQFYVSRNMVDMAIVTVKGVAAIVAGDPYTLSSVFGDSSRLSTAAMLVRPSEAVRIGWGQGVHIRRDTMSPTQLKRLFTWRHVSLSYGNERSADSEVATETFNRLNAEKMVIADSVTAAQSVSAQALASAIALDRELTLLIVDSEHGSPRLYGEGLTGSAAATNGPSP
jgi:transmembrane sensor